MPVNSTNQLVLDFEGGISDRHESCISVVRAGAYAYRKGLKSLASDMDLSQSELSRKLADNPNDPRNFTLDDLELYVTKSGDLDPIFYLVEKYLTDEELKQKRILSDFLTNTLPKITTLMKSLEVKK